MNRTLTCIRFEVSRIRTSLTGFLAIYFGCYVFFFVLFAFAPGSVHGVGNFNLSFAADIFFFVMLTSLYTNFTNNLMVFGNTRSSIFVSLSVTCVFFSAVLSVLSLLSDLLSDRLLGMLDIRSVSVTQAVYGSSNSAQSLLFVFCTLVLISGIALFFGALSYRFGRFFRVVFWISFGLIATVGMNAGEAFGLLDSIFSAAKWYVGYGAPHGLLWGSLHFALTGVVFGAAAYLSARRQPQIA